MEGVGDTPMRFLRSVISLALNQSINQSTLFNEYDDTSQSYDWQNGGLRFQIKGERMRTNNKLNPHHMTPSRNQTQATLVGGERSHHVLYYPYKSFTLLSSQILIRHIDFLLIGNSLTIVNGKRWLQMRKLLTPAFHAEILKPYTTLFQESTRTLLVSSLGWGTSTPI